MDKSTITQALNIRRKFTADQWSLFNQIVTVAINEKAAKLVLDDSEIRTVAEFIAQQFESNKG